MPIGLEELCVGTSAVVIAVDLDEKEKLRLESLGILPGSEISLLAKGAGPLLLAVGEARVMLEHKIAQKVLVV